MKKCRVIHKAGLSIVTCLSHGWLEQEADFRPKAIRAREQSLQITQTARISDNFRTRWADSVGRRQQARYCANQTRIPKSNRAWQHCLM